jgi:hypothetical protein
LSVSFTALHSLVIVLVLAIAFLFSGANVSPDIGQIELTSEEQAWGAIAETLKSQPDDYVPLSDNIIRLEEDFVFDGEKGTH